MNRLGRRGLGLVLALGCCAVGAEAQFKNGGQAIELRVRTLSQRAVTTQRIGLTDITINYCRPLVNGREIWGKAVHYGPGWRWGANENTDISFTDDVSVEGRALPAGTYGLHTIPTADQWTIIFSKNSTSWGSFSYDEKEDALRVTVKPHAAEHQEALAYTFEELKPDSAAATLRWEKVAVPFHISSDVNGIVLRSIQNQLRNTGGVTCAGVDEAANWVIDANQNLEQSMKWEDRSLQIEDRFENLLGKSMILEEQGKKQEAEAMKTKALDAANGFQLHFYCRSLQLQKKQE